MTEAKRYRKRPTVVEAVQWDGSAESAHEIIAWVMRGGGGEAWLGDGTVTGEALIAVRTLDSIGYVTAGDWIIRGAVGEHYPCRDEVFRSTYDEEEDDRRILLFGPTNEAVADWMRAHGLSVVRGHPASGQVVWIRKLEQVRGWNAKRFRLEFLPEWWKGYEGNPEILFQTLAAGGFEIPEWVTA